MTPLGTEYLKLHHALPPKNFVLLERQSNRFAIGWESTPWPAENLDSCECATWQAQIQEDGVLDWFDVSNISSPLSVHVHNFTIYQNNFLMQNTLYHVRIRKRCQNELNSPYVTFSVITPPGCDFHQHSGLYNRIECTSGWLCPSTDQFFCDYYWSELCNWCCSFPGHGVRKRCPREFPHMCENTNDCAQQKGTDGQRPAGTDRCCQETAEECDTRGGLRKCSLYPLPPLISANATSNTTIEIRFRSARYTDVNVEACPFLRWWVGIQLVGSVETFNELPQCSYAKRHNTVLGHYEDGEQWWSCVAENLFHYTDYHLHAYEICDDSRPGNAATSVAVRTFANPGLPPEHVQSAVTTGGMDVWWTPAVNVDADCVFDKWEAWFREDNTTWEYISPYMRDRGRTSLSTYHFDLSNLDSQTTYYVQVRERCQDQTANSPYTMVTNTTLPRLPSAPTARQIAEATPISLALEFEHSMDPDDCASDGRFVVQWTTDPVSPLDRMWDVSKAQWHIPESPLVYLATADCASFGFSNDTMQCNVTQGLQCEVNRKHVGGNPYACFDTNKCPMLGLTSEECMQECVDEEECRHLWFENLDGAEAECWLLGDLAYKMMYMDPDVVGWNNIGCRKQMGLLSNTTHNFTIHERCTNQVASQTSAWLESDPVSVSIRTPAAWAFAVDHPLKLHLALFNSFFIDWEGQVAEGQHLWPDYPCIEYNDTCRAGDLKPPCEISGYTIRVTNTTESRYAIGLSVANFPFEIKMLDSSTVYAVEIRTECGSLPSPWTPPFYVTTPLATRIPVSISVEATGPTSVEAEWSVLDNGDCAEVSSEAFIARAPNATAIWDDLWVPCPIDPNNTVCTLDGIPSNTWSHIRVMVKCATDTQAHGFSAIVPRLMPPLPGVVATEHVTTPGRRVPRLGDAVVRWRVTPNDCEAPQAHASIDAPQVDNAENWNVLHLRNGVTNSIYEAVIAMNCNNSGADSVTNYTFNTPPMLPEWPDNITVVTPSTRTYFSWDLPVVWNDCAFVNWEVWVTDHASGNRWLTSTFPDATQIRYGASLVSKQDYTVDVTMICASFELTHTLEFRVHGEVRIVGSFKIKFTALPARRLTQIDEQMLTLALAQYLGVKVEQLDIHITPVGMDINVSYTITSVAEQSDTVLSLKLQDNLLLGSSLASEMHVAVEVETLVAPVAEEVVFTDCEHAPNITHAFLGIECELPRRWTDPVCVPQCESHYRILPVDLSMGVRCDMNGQWKIVNDFACYPDWVVSDWSANCSSTCGVGEERREVHCVDGGTCVFERPIDRRSCYATSGCTWTLGAWEVCSSHCGTGTRLRTVGCVTGNASDCTHLSMPPVEEACDDTSGCDWVIDSWSECSTQCGKGQRTRGVRCPTGNSMDCERTDVPSTVEYCTRTTGCSWVVEPWSACSSMCGAGKQERAVTCLSGHDGDCDALGPAPTSVQECYGLTCAWGTSNWGACDVTCGQGMQVRSAECPSGRSEDCGLLPPTIQPCVDLSTCAWSVAEWSACSSVCGSGSRQRVVECPSGVDADCVATTGQAKPDNQDACYATSGCEWNTGSWGPCTTQCGDGTYTREVSCSSGIASDCSASMPASVAQCRDVSGCAWRIAEWQPCANDCGEGTRTREVSCPSTDVADCGSPVALEEACRETSGCGWNLSPWSDCPTVCGTATQQRTYTCPTGQVGDCAHLELPSVLTQSCHVTDGCLWEVGGWTPCSSSCGNGIRERSVTCPSHEEDCVLHAEKPTTHEECKDTSACEWVVGAWATCTTECGVGEKRRDVRCLSGDATDCAGEAPAHVQGCHATSGCAWSVGAWDACPTTCGNATQHRYVVCGSGNDPDCAALAQPSTTLACVATHGCQWVTTDWSRCDVDCGAGAKTRSATCASGNHDDCADALPALEDACVDTSGCAWSVGEWQECSAQCGAGTQLRDVACPSGVDADCSEQKPAEIAPCYGTAGCVWALGNWSTCSATCGDGTGARDVLCSSGRESDCESGSRPLGTRTCRDVSQCSWGVSPWSQCSSGCGSGQRARTATCPSGRLEDCAGTIVLERTCYETSGCGWEFGSWSGCSSQCGSGVQSRNVTCPSGAQSDCGDEPVSLLTQPCTAHSNCSWQWTNWASCSASCGLGLQTRNVTCPSGTNAHCDSSKPSSETPCTGTSCPYRVGIWSLCSALCGNGTVTRNVTCSGNSTSDCDAEAPTREQPCAGRACRWHVGAWSECPTTCNVDMATTRTRVVSCEGRPDGDDTDCGGIVKPAHTSQCDDMCGSWNMGEWGPCSVTCGVGAQQRSVNCSTAACDVGSTPRTSRLCVATCPWSVGSWQECACSGSRARNVTCSGDALRGESCGPRPPAKSEECTTAKTCTWDVGRWKGCKQCIRTRAVACNAAGATTFGCVGAAPATADICCAEEGLKSEPAIKMEVRFSAEWSAGGAKPSTDEVRSSIALALNIDPKDISEITVVPVSPTRRLKALSVGVGALFAGGVPPRLLSGATKYEYVVTLRVYPTAVVTLASAEFLTTLQTALGSGPISPMQIAPTLVEPPTTELPLIQKQETEKAPVDEIGKSDPAPKIDPMPKSDPLSKLQAPHEAAQTSLTWVFVAAGACLLGSLCTLLYVWKRFCRRRGWRYDRDISPEESAIKDNESTSSRNTVSTTASIIFVKPRPDRDFAVGEGNEKRQLALSCNTDEAPLSDTICVRPEVDVLASQPVRLVVPALTRPGARPPFSPPCSPSHVGVSPTKPLPLSVPATPLAPRQGTTPTASPLHFPPAPAPPVPPLSLATGGRPRRQDRMGAAPDIARTAVKSLTHDMPTRNAARAQDPAWVAPRVLPDLRAQLTPQLQHGEQAGSASTQQNEQYLGRTPARSSRDAPTKDPTRLAAGTTSKPSESHALPSREVALPHDDRRTGASRPSNTETRRVAPIAYHPPDYASKWSAANQSPTVAPQRDAPQKPVPPPQNSSSAEILDATSSVASASSTPKGPSNRRRKQKSAPGSRHSNRTPSKSGALPELTSYRAADSQADRSTPGGVEQ